MVLLTGFMKVIHVKLYKEWGYLPYKGSVVAVSEIDGKYIFWELFDLFDDESFAIFGPAYDIIVFIILNGKRYTSKIS